MFELTPDFAGTSIVVTFVFMLISLGLYFYTIYLNWRQAKVNNQMGELLEIAKDIKNILKEKKKSK